MSQSQRVPSPELTQEQKIAENVAIVENKEMEQVNLEIHRERKRLKKRKRDKLKQKLLHDDKKRRKRHRCLDANCKHRKHHKKHRKHKKHHHTVDVPVVEEKPSIEPNIEEFEDNTNETNETEEFPEYQIVANPEDEVTMDDIIEADKSKVKICSFSLLFPEPAIRYTAPVTKYLFAPPRILSVPAQVTFR